MDRQRKRSEETNKEQMQLDAKNQYILRMAKDVQEPASGGHHHALGTGCDCADSIPHNGLPLSPVRGVKPHTSIHRKYRG